METKTKEQLIQEKETLESDIDRLQKIIDASSQTTFKIIIDDIKQQMIENIENERWSAVKSNLSEVTNVNGTREFISKQTDLLDKKNEELLDLISKIDNYQPSLFEDQKEETKSEYTGIVVNQNEIRVGDVFCRNEICYLAVTKSKDMEDKYALISNSFEGEKLLQYPANAKLLVDADYIGNIYDEDNVAALNAYHKIEENIG